MAAGLSLVLSSHISCLHNKAGLILRKYLLPSTISVKVILQHAPR